MKKILIVPTIGLSLEGITTVIYNYVNAMNREDIQFHFMTYGNLRPSVRERFEKLGHIEMVSDRQQNTAAYIKDFMGLLKSHSFDAVHVHGNSGTMIIEAACAKICGVERIMVHAHSTKTDHPMMNAVLKYPMMILANERIACSEASGKWLYGSHEYTVLNNAIDIPKFAYDPDSRKRCRAELGVEDEFLVGHIGHFSEPKNHFYLIDIFDEFHKLAPNSKLLLVSDGPRFEQVKQKVAQLGLQDAVIFAGRRADADRLYQAMDAFILPSCWEGLPLVALEAQAAGLPVIASDRITRDIQCTDRLSFLSIDGPARIWAEKLAELSGTEVDRNVDSAQQLRRHGFDIALEAEKLRQMYLQ